MGVTRVYGNDMNLIATLYPDVQEVKLEDGHTYQDVVWAMYRHLQGVSEHYFRRDQAIMQYFEEGRKRDERG